MKKQQTGTKTAENSSPEINPNKKTLRGLDAVNFLMADVQTGFGPFLAIYLAASLHWNPRDIVIAISTAGIAALIAQTPVGLRRWAALQTRSDRHRCGASRAGLALHRFFSQLRAGPLRANRHRNRRHIFPARHGWDDPRHRRPRRARFAHWAQRNLRHAGNVFSAVAAGLLGYLLARRSIFYFTVVMCVITIGALFFIRGSEIDFARSCGCEKGEEMSAKTGAISGILSVLKNHSLLIFMLSVVLFHFANAAMLPLIGQKLARGHAKSSTLFMAVCIVGAQMVMIPVALAAGRFAKSWGRKAVFIVGFAALPLRAVLYTFSDNPYFLVSVQLMDGIGAAIFGVVSVLVIADLTRGTGRFNFTLGVVATATGLGASLSNGITGFIVQRGGFNAAVLFLAVIAGIALAIFWIFMPETGAGKGAQNKRLAAATA